MSSSAQSSSTCALIAAFLLPLYTSHKQHYPSTPLVLALSGPQGIGKTTVTASLYDVLSSPSYSLNAVVLSLDDLYYPFTFLSSLRNTYPNNNLLSVRGNPGTHDVPLGLQVLQNLKIQHSTKIPVYDKSLHGGRGDRVLESEWPAVYPPYDIVIFEGWCVGFEFLEPSLIERVYNKADKASSLRKYRLEDILWINEKLKDYERIWTYFDVFVHLDAESLEYIPSWRIQQEHMLIGQKGAGMSDEEVRSFVDVYMPLYEICVPGLRNGGFIKDGKGDEGNRIPVPTMQIHIGESREVRGIGFKNFDTQDLELGADRHRVEGLDMLQSLRSVHEI